MLLRLKLRFSEVFFGALLAVAIFAIGMVFESSLYPPNPEHGSNAIQQSESTSIPDKEKTQSLWVPTDSVGLYTLVLAVFTGLLVGVSTVQGYFLLRADKTARISAETARASIALARDEFISTHRPRLIVYSLDFIGGTPESDDVEGPIRVGLHYVNAGDSLAKVKQVGTKLVHLLKPAMPTGIVFEVENIDPPLEVKSGRHAFRITVDAFDQERFLFNSAADGYSLVCLGYIVYSDESGTDRQVGFAENMMGRAIAGFPWTIQNTNIPTRAPIHLGQR